MKLYRYVGPRGLADRVRSELIGAVIRSPNDLRDWLRASGSELNCGSVTVTYVVDEMAELRVADRRSEHVACAGGKSVQSAGEITFLFGPTVDVTTVSNQSTGYCPEPDSWPAVSDALTRAGLIPPDAFTRACEFRRCTRCQNLELVKDLIFECSVCGNDLPTEYNVQ